MALCFEYSSGTYAKFGCFVKIGQLIGQLESGICEINIKEAKV
jgi:hypothetical protein